MEVERQRAPTGHEDDVVGHGDGKHDWLPQIVNDNEVAKVPWGNVDDKLHSHPKTDKAGFEAMGLWVLGLSWSQDYKTGGEIPFERAALICKGAGKAKKYVARLLEAGFWEPHPTKENTYLMHDFGDWNPAAAAAALKRADISEKRRTAGKAGAAARWQVPSGCHGNDDGKTRQDDGNQDPVRVRAGTRARVSGSPDHGSSPGVPDPGCLGGPSKTSTSGEADEPDDLADERPSEIRVAGPRRAENQDDDGCFGEAVRGWGRGVSSVTGVGCTVPRYGVELDRLVDALITHHPETAGRDAWAQQVGAEFARSGAPQLGVYPFVNWLNGGRKPFERGPRGAAKVQPAPASGSEWESGELARTKP